MPEKTIQHGAVDTRAATAGVESILRPLPEARFGLLFAASLLFADITGSVVGDFGLHMFRFLVLLAGVSYWFFCVYRLHQIVNELDSRYPISPQAAVGLHFPPFLSLFWIFKWPIEMSRFINRRGATKVMSGGWIGLGIFAAVSVGQAYWGAGLAALFLLTWYMADKLSHEVQFHQVALPVIEAASREQAALGVLAGNIVNYLIANTGFVLLLLLLNSDAPGSALLVVLTLTILASGFAAGVSSGNVARRSGLALGLLANLAVLGSVAVGLYVIGQYDMSLWAPPALVFSVLMSASFGLSVLGTEVGERWHREGRYPYLWLIVQKEAPQDRDEGTSPPAKPAGLSAPQVAGGMALGNLVGVLILLFYRYPAAFLEAVWGNQIYFVARMADGLVIVTGAFVAAYVAMLIAKAQPRVVGIGANLIMYLTMAGVIFRSLVGGGPVSGIVEVLPFLPVVVIVGLLGARAAQTNIRG